MALVTVAATQMACSWDLDENIQKAEEQVVLAAEDGAEIILLQELFQSEAIWGGFAKHWHLGLGLTIILTVALLPRGTRVLLQSNDYFSEPTHIN